MKLQKILKYSIKQGKKDKVEKSMRKLVKRASLDKVENLWDVLENAVENSMPYINLKTTRIRGKNTLMPTLMKKNHSEFLCYSWIYKGALSKNKKTFEENLLLELIEASQKKSYSYKKCQEIYKLAEMNMVRTRR